MNVYTLTHNSLLVTQSLTSLKSIVSSIYTSIYIYIKCFIYMWYFFYTGSIISVCGLQLLVHEALRYQSMRPQVTSPPPTPPCPGPTLPPQLVPPYPSVCVWERERARVRASERASVLQGPHDIEWHESWSVYFCVYYCHWKIKKSFTTKWS